MINKLIKQDASYKYDKENNKLSIEGTNVDQLGDILADILLLVPHKCKIGLVSYGAYVQATKILSDLLDTLDVSRPLYISGHSLGGGIAQILTMMIDHNFQHKGIHLDCRGSIKVLSKQARETLDKVDNVFIDNYAVRHRDIVPVLGWWLEPIHNFKRIGKKKRHLLDFDINEHIMYWE